MSSETLLFIACVAFVAFYLIDKVCNRTMSSYVTNRTEIYISQRTYAYIPWKLIFWLAACFIVVYSIGDAFEIVYHR